MNGNGNGTERLLGQLIAKVDSIAKDLHEIKENTATDIHDLRSSHTKHADEHHDRIRTLEDDMIARKAGAKWLAWIMGGLGVAGGVVVQAIFFVTAKLWQSPT